MRKAANAPRLISCSRGPWWSNRRRNTSISQIDSYERTSGQTLAPTYAKLFDADATSGRGTVRAALFFIYDREGDAPLRRR
mgnify:CR=1 FL=1